MCESAASAASSAASEARVAASSASNAHWCAFRPARRSPMTPGPRDAPYSAAYFAAIQAPMDFGTIRHNVEDSAYGGDFALAVGERAAAAAGDARAVGERTAGAVVARPGGGGGGAGDHVGSTAKATARPRCAQEVTMEWDERRFKK